MTDPAMFRWTSSGEVRTATGSFVSSRGRTLFEIPSDELFRRYRHQATVTSRTALLLGFAIAFLFMIGVVGSQPVSVIGPVATLIVIGIVGWTFLAATQVWHRRVRRLSRDSELAVYAIGRTPIGMSYLVISPNSLDVISKEDVLLARLSNADISAIAIAPGKAGVGVVIACRDEFVEMPIVLKVGGPTAQAWSIDGLAGRGRLLNALVDDLRRNHLPIPLATEQRASNS